MQWPVTVKLSNGKSWGADIVISAIGVKPNVGWLPAAVQRDDADGGLVVDRCPHDDFEHQLVPLLSH